MWAANPAKPSRNGCDQDLAPGNEMTIWLHHLAVETRAYMSSTARGGWDTGGTGSGQAWFDFRSACKTDAEVGLSDKVVLLKG